MPTANMTTPKSLYRFDCVHQALPHPDAFGEEHVRQYWEQGFVAVENVFSAREVADANAALSDLIAGKQPGFAHIQFETGVDLAGLSVEQRELHVRKLMHFCAADPRLAALRDHPVLHRIMERIIGTPLRIAQEMALLKPPHIGREKPWHQDTAYFLLAPLDKIIGTWTALDAATAENGCMHMIPASHLGGPKPHHHVRDCQLADEQVEAEKDVIVPLRPGGVLFFHGLIHHGTPANQSPSRRRAVQLHYSSTECRKITPEEHARLFADENGYAGCVHP